MVPYNISNITLATITGVLCSSLAGCCSKNICVKTIDEATHSPLPGVVTIWQQDRYKSFRKFVHYGPIELSPSGPNGTIDVDGLRCGWTSRFEFSCPGYKNVYGSYYTGQGLALSGQMQYYAAGQLKGEFYLEGNLEQAITTNGYFIVPMPREAGKR